MESNDANTKLNEAIAKHELKFYSVTRKKNYLKPELFLLDMAIEGGVNQMAEANGGALTVS